MGQLITLYHGSDGRMIRMSKAEREDYLSKVDDVISQLWEVFKPYYSEYVPRKIVKNGQVIDTYMRSIERYKGRFENLGKIDVYDDLMEKLGMLDLRFKGSGFFQYGSLYLAAIEKSAGKYARRSFAGGELGLIAYRLLEAQSILNLPEWNPDTLVQSEINQILDFSMEAKSDPVILTIDNIDSDNLLDEKGDEPTVFFNILSKFGIVSDFKFRYKGELDLTRYPMKHLKTD